MATTLPLCSPVHAVVSGVREAQKYEGFGDSRRVVGRETDSQGRPVSRVSCSAIIGSDWHPTATVELPDTAAAGLSEGQLVVIERPQGVRIAGGDFGAFRMTVLTEAAPKVIGQISDILTSAAPARSLTTTKASE